MDVKIKVLIILFMGIGLSFTQDLVMVHTVYHDKFTAKEQTMIEETVSEILSKKLFDIKYQAELGSKKKQTEADLIQFADSMQFKALILFNLVKEGAESILLYKIVFFDKRAENSDWQITDAGKRAIEDLLNKFSDDLSTKLVRHGVAGSLLLSWMKNLDTDTIFEPYFQVRREQLWNNHSVGAEFGIGPKMISIDLNYTYYIGKSFYTPYVGMHFASVSFYQDERFFQLVPKLGYTFNHYSSLEMKYAITTSKKDRNYLILGFSLGLSFIY
jgi:hypothetical protein